MDAVTADLSVVLALSSFHPGFLDGRFFIVSLDLNSAMRCVVEFNFVLRHGYSSSFSSATASIDSPTFSTSQSESLTAPSLFRVLKRAKTLISFGIIKLCFWLLMSEEDDLFPRFEIEASVLLDRALRAVS